MTNFNASPIVRTSRADNLVGNSYRANVARRGIPKAPVRWFLREWMETAGLGGRGAQTKMMELTGWSKATMSQLYNGTQGYSPDIIETAAVALNVEPHELLMHPERAMAMRKFRETAATIVETSPPASTADETRRTGTNG